MGTNQSALLIFTACDFSQFLLYLCDVSLQIVSYKKIYKTHFKIVMYQSTEIPTVAAAIAESLLASTADTMPPIR